MASIRKGLKACKLLTKIDKEQELFKKKYIKTIRYKNLCLFFFTPATFYNWKHISLHAVHVPCAPTKNELIIFFYCRNNGTNTMHSIYHILGLRPRRNTVE